MFKNKYKTSKYLSGLEIKKMFESIYKDKLLGTLKVSIQYHFERDLFDNEVMYIYTDRPATLNGGENGKYLYALIAEYKKHNKKCKGIKVFETNFLNVN